jgi:hypothetical protein
MERYLRKSAADGQHRGLGTAATIESALQQQAVARSGMKARNPCTTCPIGSMENLTQKVKTEIPINTWKTSCGLPLRPDANNPPMGRLALTTALTVQSLLR